MRRSLAIVALFAACLCGCKTLYGIAAVSPCRWPAPSQNDWDAFWSEVGEYEVQGAHAHWAEDGAGVVPAVVRAVVEKAPKPVVVIGLRDQWTDLKRQSLETMLRALVLDHEPDVLCIGSEWNYEQADPSLELAVIESSVALVKSLRPKLPVCTVLQYEAPAPARIPAGLDFVAYTSYPAQRYATVAEIPATYYTARLGTAKVAFTEVGWPVLVGGASEQAAFARRFKAIRPKGMLFASWISLHDFSECPHPYDVAGLRSVDGVSRPAEKEWLE